MIEWRDWGAYSAGTLGTKPMIVGAKYITLEELVDEVMPLLSRYAPITIEDQIPVFTEWVESALSESILSRRSNSWKRHWG
jgi:hypothetical protein